MNEEEVVIVNDSINLQGAPHTVCEISRESLSTISEKTDEELYYQAPEEEKGEEGDKTPEEGGGENPPNEENNEENNGEN